MRQVLAMSKKAEEERVASEAAVLAPAIKSEKAAAPKTGSKLPSKAAIKAKLTAVLQNSDLSSVTEKKVRRKIEEAMGLDHKSLDTMKKEIKEWIDTFLKDDVADDDDDDDADNDEGGGGADNDDISDDGIEDMVPKKKKVATKKPAADKAADKKRKATGKAGKSGASAGAASKKAKKAPSVDDGPKPVLTIHTKSGAEAPKKLKELQSDLMTGSEFMRDAAPLEIELFGNTLIGEPRTFTSGNRGWYLGGKIEVEVGGKTVWMSAGLNLVAVGSGQWED